MSDENMDAGQGAVAPGVLQSDVEGKDTPPVAGQEEPFVHTFRTKEDAQKGIEELVSQRDATATKLQAAEAKAQKLQDEYLAKLTDVVTSKEAPADPKGQYAQEVQNLQDQISKRVEAGEDYADLVVSIMQATAEQMEQSTSAARTRELEKFQTEISSLKSQLAEYDPDWVSADKEKVAEFQSEFGVDRQTAIKMAKKFAAKNPEQPPTPQAPGSTVSGRVTEGEGPRLTDSQREAALRVNPQLTEDDLKQMAVNMAARKRSR